MSLRIISGAVRYIDLIKERQRILVAPALAIERGHNIVDERGHSSLNSVFFVVFLRPMGIPDDVKEKSIKLNGYMADKLYDYPYTDAYEKNLYVRREAAKFWVRMNRTSKGRLDNLEDVEIKRDSVSTTFVLILQIFEDFAELQMHPGIHRQFILQTVLS